MPIFSKKFEIKSIPPRGKRQNINCPPIQEKLDDFYTININLNKKHLKFVEGTWIQTQQSTYDTDDITTMKRKVQKLEEENNLNQIKVDVLLDMLTENLSELSVLKNSNMG